MPNSVAHPAMWSENTDWLTPHQSQVLIKSHVQICERVSHSPPIRFSRSSNLKSIIGCTMTRALKHLAQISGIYLFTKGYDYRVFGNCIKLPLTGTSDIQDCFLIGQYTVRKIFCFLGIFVSSKAALWSCFHPCPVVGLLLIVFCS